METLINKLKLLILNFKIMKRILFILLSVSTLVFISCEQIQKVVEPNTELYTITDKFVESLHTTYESYGLFSQEYTKYTSDNKYKINPIGRLINIRVESTVDNSVYEDLVKDFKEHYKNNTYVKDVYICNGGTIMIDCRN